MLLFFVAMPLKYLAGRPEFVRVVGTLHGGLVVLFLLALLLVGFARRWSLLKIAAGIVAAGVPLGPFVFDASLRKEERTVRASGG